MRLKLSESIVIKASPEAIFDLTQDYNQRLAWDTFLKKAELIGSKEAGVGVKAWCVSKHGLGMETEYISFNRPKVTAVKQTKKSLLFSKFSGSWVFEQTATNSTKVVFTYSYSLNFPLNLTSKLVNNILTKNVQQRLKNLKLCIETNNIPPIE
jgi:ribosome-associated toxin RatA of RatAB toxin-antitoxin module